MSASLPTRALADARTIARGALWNIAGRLGPLLVAVIATPFLIAALGITRWGVFTLALSLVGIMGIFDFGIGRALTRLIADRLATADEAEAATPVITGLALMTGFGALAALVMAGLAHSYVTHALVLPEDLRPEVLTALYILCASAPLVILNAALWGVLSAFQRFGEANRVMVPLQAMYYLGPLMVLPFVRSLVPVMLVLVACRAAMTYSCWRISVRAMPALRHGRIDLRSIAPLLRFGGWLTVSNLIWPLLLYLDRFIIAALLSAEAAAYYATPFDLIIRFSVLPIAVMQSAFPAMTTMVRADPAASAVLFRQSTIAIIALLFPAALAVVALAHPILAVWLGADFADHAAPVLRLFGVGVLFMCADSVPIALLDGIGRPDVNAKLAIGNLVIYVPMLFLLIDLNGLEGAALAWTWRVAAAFTVRLYLCTRHFPPVAQQIRRLASVYGTAFVAMSFPLAAWNWSSLALTCAAASAVFAGAAWRLGFAPAERAGLIRRFSFRS